MKIKTKKGSVEREVLIGMIASKEVLSQIAPRWTGKGLFGTVWSNIIGGWCIDYYEKYDKAPKQVIKSVFTAWAEEQANEDTVNLVQTYLEGLSDQYSATGINAKYLVDEASKLFNKVKLEKIKNQLEGLIEAGDYTKAFQILDKSNKIELGLGSGVDFFQDIKKMHSVLDTSVNQTLITFPGALGEFFGDTLERDAFVSILAPEKRGKTFVMQELAWQAVMQQRRVLFLECGDLSERQILNRFYIRAIERPRKAGRFTVPKLITKKFEDGFPDVQTITKSAKLDLSKVELEAKFQEIIGKLKTKEPLLKVYTYPTMSITVKDITELVKSLTRKGWPPDVIVTDYADILAPCNGGIDTRHQINETWARMRGLSETSHSCVITASQADAKSYKGDLLSMENFSEDKRKFAHVTACFGLNQKELEKKKDVMRLNWIVRREAESLQSQVVYVAGSRSIANVFVTSTW